MNSQTAITQIRQPVGNARVTGQLKRVHQLARAGDYEQIIRLLESAALAHPSFPLYKRKLDEYQALLRKLRVRGAAALSGNAQASFREEPPHALTEDEKRCIRQITDLASSGDLDEAERKFAALPEAVRQTASGLHTAAALHFAKAEYDAALRLAEKAISADPKQRPAYGIAERAAIALGRFEEAKRLFLAQPELAYPAQPKKRGKNPSLPVGLVLPPVRGGNDYTDILARAESFRDSRRPYTKTVSIVMPVYNRKQVLANTLAALTHQTYPADLTEIIVVDDGSSDEVLRVIRKYEHRLCLHYARQKDHGYRLAAARNIGLRLATGDAIVFMDADILPMPSDLESYMRVLHVTDNAVLIGHRRYVDVSTIDDDAILRDINAALSLPSITPNNDVAAKAHDEGVATDWRYPLYAKTDDLKTDLWPFTKAAGGNIAFPRQLLSKAGFVDEAFNDLGGGGIEHGHRMYNAGAYFIPMLCIESLHQEPLRSERTDDGWTSFRAAEQRLTRQILGRKCPVPYLRRYVKQGSFDVPKVSIYMPAYNAEAYIAAAVQSCLDQTEADLEVCICDDGSTDNTLTVLHETFGGEKRVRWMTQTNQGIGAATNAAINMCRGMYIGQLDADDVLKPRAAQVCSRYLDTKNVDAVYSDYDCIDEKGSFVRNAWCSGEYSREWMLSGMIASPFRMFRRRLWSRMEGCNTHIRNAVDLDLWLKFSEAGDIAHVHDILYSYRWHGINTSVLHRREQEINQRQVIEDSLRRQGLADRWLVKPSGNRLKPRGVRIVEAPFAT